MPSIETHAVLPADPETVFAMLRRVEDFPQYTRAVETVTHLGGERYRWQVRVAGVEYQWVVEIVQSEAPERITWKSVTGISNTGRYHLTPVNGGTDLRLVIDYTLNSRILDRTVGRMAVPVVRRISTEVLDRVRERLAAQHG
jgi:uncharacterized membrane protein